MTQAPEEPDRQPRLVGIDLPRVQVEDRAAPVLFVDARAVPTASSAYGSRRKYPPPPTGRFSGPTRTAEPGASMSAPALRRITYGSRGDGGMP